MTDDRRERYAEALYTSTPEPKLPWELVGRSFREHWLKRADAAMAVADEEVHAVREQMRTAWWEMHQEIVRLRTELSARSRR